jgi:O-methyltransferase involved in polyketide biosynthesis
MATHNEKSSFTANALAFRRTFTGIRFSREIFDSLQTEQPLTLMEREHAMSWPAATPYFEARYLMTNILLGKQKVRQIIEFAAGLSPRGISMTEDPELSFIEIDLQCESDLKRRLVENLIQRGAISPRPNLHFIPGNAADPDTYRRVRALLSNVPFAVVCEGLLRYVSFSDKEIMAEQIRELLRHFGGVWITPDIEFRDDLARNERYKKMVELGVDVRPNLFKDRDHALTFFQNFGLQLNCFPLSEIADQLVSPGQLNFDPKEVVGALKPHMACVISLA